MDNSHVVTSNKLKLTRHRRYDFDFENHRRATRTQPLYARDPSPQLLSGLGDLPIVGPILNWLIPGSSSGGNNGGGNSGGGDGGSGDGGSSGGGSGDSGNSGGGSSGGDTTTPPSNGGSTGGDSSGGDNSGGSGSGNSGSGSGNSGSGNTGSGDSQNGNNGGQTTTQPSSGNNNSNSGNGNQNTAVGSGTSTSNSASPSNTNSSGSSSGNSNSPASPTGSPQGVANAGSDVGNEPQQSNSNEQGVNGSSPVRGSSPTNVPSDRGNNGSAGTGGGSSVPPSTTTDSPGPSLDDGKSSGGLSKGAIAGISIVAVIILLVLCVFCVRRVYRKRRADRRRRWTISGRPLAGGSGPEMTAKSARSSFATNIDAGLSPLSPAYNSRWHDALVSPPLGQVQVLHTGSSAGSGTRSSVGTLSSEFSVGTVNDTSTWDQHSSLFVQRPVVPIPASTGSNVNTNTNSNASTTVGVGGASPPMCVRPFSPSESWSFPQPPSTHSETATLANLSRRGSLANSAAVTVARAQSTYSINSDPFADLHTPVTTVHPTPHQSKTSVHKLHSSETRICRPFMPSLADELSVQRGEPVKVLTKYDDGWVLIEKIAAGGEKGLIPLMCLEEEVLVDKSVPPFMASRRVSSMNAGDPFADGV